MDQTLAMIILAIVQGVAEWFPISSSGHLVLVSHLIGYTNNTLAFDVALHFGTLMAVFVYFGKDITDIARDLLSFRFNTPSAKMGLYLIVATIPAAILGFLFNDFLEHTLNNLLLLSVGLGITSILLFITSLDFGTKKRKLSFKVAFFIGLAQCASLFRGISRSGSTICSGTLLGLDQREAARFSFLLSIPIIFGANLLTSSSATLPTSYLIPTLVAFVVGLATIHVLLKFVLTSKKNLRWFGVYVLLLAIATAIWALTA